MPIALDNALLMFVALGLSTALAWWSGKKVAMTDMPQLVAAFHSLVGLAAVLVGWAAYLNPEAFGILGADGLINPVSRLEAGLGIAIGVSVRNMPITVDGQYIDLGPRQRNIIIALDYDMTKIIPGDHWLLIALKEGLNFIHFPSPAIRISPNFISYGLYF